MHSRTLAILVVSALFSSLLTAGGPGSDGWFPFAIPGDDATKNAADFSGLHHRPAGAKGFVKVLNGRFYAGDSRLRIWGVNFCFGGNFPSHQDAEKIAAHLSKLGINAVRIHHQDKHDAPKGFWLPPKDGARELDPAQIDRLDYFLAQLHKSGIYANLNLHVSRKFTEAEGFPESRDFKYDKALLYFVPEMRKRFKLYCKNYLLHRNPYRELRRVDDPAVAMLEITNENRFSRERLALFKKLPPQYRAILQKKWNTWLASRYGTTATLRRAWLPAGEPLTDVLVESSGFSKGLGEWVLNTDRGAVKATPVAGPAVGTPGIRLAIAEPCAKAYHQEIHFRGLSVEKGRAYTFTFWIRGTKSGLVTADVSQSGPDSWNPVGHGERVEIQGKWRKVIRRFVATKSLDGGARVCFKFGGNSGDIFLAGIKLQRGAQFDGMLAGQRVEDATMAIPDEVSTLRAKADFRTLMAEIEGGFLKEITDYLRKDLQVKVPITGSQVNYHGLKVTAAECGYTDVHTYWQHPRFPGRPWDPRNWIVQNVPMEESPGKNSMTGIATWRLLDRPYTVSEWNIPNPNNYAASTVPFAAVFSGLQDWDGVFFFTYHNNQDNWRIQGLHDFFSFNGQPVKLALMGVSANLFVRGDLKPLKRVLAGSITKMLPSTLSLSHRIGVDPKLKTEPAFERPDKTLLAAPDRRVVWDTRNPEQAMLTVDTPATRGLFGLVAGRDVDLSGLRIKVGKIDRDYACILASSLDGKKLETSKRLLLVAVGRAENPGIIWNEDRSSVGNKWGKGPAEVNGIAAEISINARIKAIHALDGTGKRMTTLRFTQEGAAGHWTIGPEHQTLWYEIELGE